MTEITFEGPKEDWMHAPNAFKLEDSVSGGTGHEYTGHMIIVEETMDGFDPPMKVPTLEDDKPITIQPPGCTIIPQEELTMLDPSITFTNFYHSHPDLTIGLYVFFGALALIFLLHYIGGRVMR